MSWSLAFQLCTSLQQFISKVIRMSHSFAWRVWIVSYNNLSTDQRCPHRWALIYVAMPVRTSLANQQFFLKLRSFYVGSTTKACITWQCKLCVCVSKVMQGAWHVLCQKVLLTYFSDCTWHLKPLCIGRVQSAWKRAFRWKRLFLLL
jgi:hypothetical protein